MLTTIGEHLDHQVVAHGEAPLAELGIRPDYAIRVDGAVTGYLEAKKPDLSLDPSTFRGHNKRQWEQLRDLPDLIYTNGTEWRLYRHGELASLARLSGDLRTSGERLAVVDDGFERVAADFLAWSPRPITSVSQLVISVAPLCRLLRSSVLDQLTAERNAIRAGADEWEQPFAGLVRDWRNLLFPTASDETFADGYAQTLTFALLLARTENIDFSSDTSMYEIAGRLRVGQSHALMSKALELLTGSASATDQLKVTLDLLERVIGAVDWGPIRDVRNVAYLHLYESFLEVYDPRLREDGGCGARQGDLRRQRRRTSRVPGSPAMRRVLLAGAAIIALAACGGPPVHFTTLQACHRLRADLLRNGGQPDQPTLLRGAAATSGSNAWAVGTYLSSRGADLPLIVHWDGTAWTQRASSITTGTNVLQAVSASSAADAWAVGTHYNTTAGASQTLILHWNGTAWTQMPSPNPGGSTGMNVLSAVAVRYSNVGAVGYYDEFRPFALHL